MTGQRARSVSKVPAGDAGPGWSSAGIGIEQRMARRVGYLAAAGRAVASLSNAVCAIANPHRVPFPQCRALCRPPPGGLCMYRLDARTNSVQLILVQRRSARQA